MLDPFTALSLAGNIVQFVDFSSKLVNEASEIYRSGSTKANDELETVTNDLIDLTSCIQDELVPASVAATSKV